MAHVIQNAEEERDVKSADPLRRAQAAMAAHRGDISRVLAGAE